MPFSKLNVIPSLLDSKNVNENVKTGSGSMFGIVKITIVDSEAGDLVLEAAAAAPEEEATEEETPATKEPDVP